MGPRSLAVALALLVVLSGCSALSGDTQTPTGTPTAVEHHEIAIASIIVPYDATVTVEKDGETLLEETVSGDADDAYAVVGTLEEPGPYTVTVNTSIEFHEGPLEERFQIRGDLGNATAIRMNYHGIRADTFELPRRNATYPMGAYSSFMNLTGSKEVTLQYRIWYEGRLIADNSTDILPDELYRVAPLERTGVYRVSVRAKEGGWTNKTLVVTDADEHIRVSVGPQGRIQGLRVSPAYEWIEDEP